VCEAAGANVQEVANGIGLDERIGRRFLNAGIGFGGSCFPKDLSAFIKIAEQIGYDFKLLKEVQNINAGQMERFVKKITDTLWVLKDKKIGVLGLAFKQNTDDVRSSPAIDLCQRMLKEGATLRVHDPKAMDKARSLLPPDVTYVDDMNAVAEGCDALVVATEWDEFKQLDLARAKQSLTHPILFDGRNLFDPAEMEKLGWIYKSVGR
jgi:UDPglucose 6-dehydrogenase